MDARGEIVGHYRKHHIPMSSHFQEKFYFRPGNLGYPVFDSSLRAHRHHDLLRPSLPRGRARLGLNGAQFVFVPTATTRRGFSRSVWEAELRGHAIANGFFVGGVNRVGTELDSEYYESQCGSSIPSERRWPRRATRMRRWWPS